MENQEDNEVAKSWLFQKTPAAKYRDASDALAKASAKRDAISAMRDKAQASLEAAEEEIEAAEAKSVESVLAGGVSADLEPFYVRLRKSQEAHKAANAALARSEEALVPLQEAVVAARRAAEDAEFRAACDDLRRLLGPLVGANERAAALMIRSRHPDQTIIGIGREYLSRWEAQLNSWIGEDNPRSDEEILAEDAARNEALGAKHAADKAADIKKEAEYQARIASGPTR